MLNVLKKRLKAKGKERKKTMRTGQFKETW